MLGIVCLCEGAHHTSLKHLCAPSGQIACLEKIEGFCDLVSKLWSEYTQAACHMSDSKLETESRVGEELLCVGTHHL